MSNQGQSVYLVDTASEPVVIKVQGRASYLNCAPIAQFFTGLIEKNRRNIVIDFAACTGMDSTFLGILAGTVLQLRKLAPPGTLTLSRLGARNLELVRNLGLHRILTIDADPSDLSFDDPAVHSFEAPQLAAADASVILRAHEALVEADGANRKRFQDVLTFLKSQAEPES